MSKTIFIIADTALELIPNNLIHSDAIIKYAKKRGKMPTEVILDSSYHYKEMNKIKDNKKRGRPDILHMCLLNLLGMPSIKKSPENYRIIIHTYKKQLIEINPLTRIPRNYTRFIGLMEQLLVKKIIKSNNEFLIKMLEEITLEEILIDIPTKNRFLFTKKGKLVDLNHFFDKNSSNDVAIIIGGFPHGDFSDQIKKTTTNKIALSDLSLDAWIALAIVSFYRK